jgi:hypothetical protein
LAGVHRQLQEPSHSCRANEVRNRVSEDRWMVAPSYDEWLTMWCGLTFGW